MHPAYLALGGTDFDQPVLELINTSRALGYVDYWNVRAAQKLPNFDGPCINWLDDCGECKGMARFLEDRHVPFHSRRGYCFVDWAPIAPWYDANKPDTRKFLGVVGIEILNAEDSTRYASVKQAITGGGVVGRTILRPRELVVRAVMVAVDEPGLNAGFEWLREATRGISADCEGDNLWFMDACPDRAADSDWPDCQMPPAHIPDPEGVMRPYVRHYQLTRIIQGPIVISQREMPSGGWMAEVEFVIACPDASAYGEPHQIHDPANLLGPTTVHNDPAAPTPTTNPTATKLGQTSTITLPSNKATLPTTWNRTIDAIPAVQTNLPNVTFEFAITADEDFEDLRIEIVDHATGDVLDGIEVDFLLAGQKLVVNPQDRSVTVNGVNQGGYVHDWDGTYAHAWRDSATPTGALDLVVDYTGTHPPTALHVEVIATGKASA